MAAFPRGTFSLFLNALKRTDQVIFYVKCLNLGDNPFTFKNVKKELMKLSKIFKNRYKVELAPNIINIIYKESRIQHNEN